MLVAHDRAHAREELDRSEDLLADDRVALHDLALGVVERALLVEDRLGDRDLADVVEDGSVAQVAQLRLVHPELTPDGLRPLHDRVRVMGGVGVLGLQRGRQRLGGAEVRAIELLVQER